MKEKIYTIPVTESFQEKSGCPFCLLYKKLEDDAIEYMLGTSYMEDDVRMDTNRIGFCHEHYEKLFAGQNRLGLGLMLLTHLQQINNDLEQLTKEAPPGERKKLFSKNKEKTMSKTFEYLDRIESSCYVCDRIQRIFSRYIDTFFYMWKKEKEMARMVQDSNGFCLKHFNILVQTGEKELREEEYKRFLSVLLPIQHQVLKTLEEDLDWFVKKFDYRYADQPWKNAKDALQRALLKIGSLYVE